MPILLSTPSKIMLWRLSLCAILLSSLLLTGCSRSPWMKQNGREVSPQEQVQCAKLLKEETRGDALEQEVFKERIEQCMLNKGYHRRPWWLLNDLHWG